MPTFKHTAIYHLVTTSVWAVPALQSWHKGFKVATHPSWHLSSPFCLTGTASTHCHPTDRYNHLNFYHFREKELLISKQAVCSKLLWLPLQGVTCLGGQECVRLLRTYTCRGVISVPLHRSTAIAPGLGSWKFDLLLFLIQVLLLFY